MLYRYIIILLLLGFPLSSQAQYSSEDFLQLLNPRSSTFDKDLKSIEENWDDGYAIYLLEMSYFAPASIRSQLITLLEKKTKQEHGEDIDRWYRYIWKKQAPLPKQYSDFKARLYRLIDHRFDEYFRDSPKTTIRLDEVRWGGVRRDGIPPLRSPQMISAKEASFLEDDHVVFGISVNGDNRAYPKRILAWHEMFTDTIGGVPITAAYCTLCGSVIVYESVLNGIHYHLGTSGFLYRSNKLMYDRETKSMWNTLQGEPVIGSLVGKNISLKRRSVVTTTWGAWKKRHPDTTVLSLDTGHRRDYSEGAAYRSYFATDELMFIVPFDDKRLKNKDEILALLPEDLGQKPIAIDSNLLKAKKLYPLQYGKQQLIALTDKSGAHRVYDAKGVVFTSWDEDTKLIAQGGKQWVLTEDALIGPDKEKLHRYPSHNAFWFGWHAAYPDTVLLLRQ